MKAQYFYVIFVKLTSRWQAKYKWYNIIVHLVTQIRILTKIFFYFFDSFQIVSTCRFCNACARLIFVELFINRINLLSFFFSSSSLYKLMCADARVTLLVYYENDFFRVLRSTRLLIICKQRELYWNLMFAFCMRFDCSITIS